MSKKTDKLLEYAKSLNEEELQPLIDALEALGDKAKGSQKEAQDLTEAIQKIEGEKAPTVDSEESVPDVETTPENDEAPKNTAKNAFGIKLIGGKWYSEKDRYQKGFDTSEECANFFNS